MLRNRSRLFVMLLMAAAVAMQFSCATLSSDATDEQRYFEVKTQWNTVLTGAVVFARSPAGQARPEVIRKIQAVAFRVQGVITDLDISMCYIGVPTPTDPAPPSADSCVALTGDAKARRFGFASRVLVVAIPEITALLTSAR